MNKIDEISLKKANDEAIFNLYLYLAHKTNPRHLETLNSIVKDLDADFKKHPRSYNRSDIYRLNILKSSVFNNPILSMSEIISLTRSKDGLTFCCFIKPSGEISIAFKGTGNGEWIDNGEGLSGIAEENTYISYEDEGKTLYRKTVLNDFASDQQVEALNKFNELATKYGWNEKNHISLSGHSKGANKAQFITIHSDLVDECYSFNGQGFSPEAIKQFKKKFGLSFEQRRKKIKSFSTDNDYVNVLGNRLMPQSNIYYLKSYGGIHNIEAMLDRKGKFRAQTEQGKLSLYVESISKQLMKMDSSVRQYATLGVMNIFQKYLGRGTPVNNDSVSFEKTIAGISIATASLIYRLTK